MYGQRLKIALDKSFPSLRNKAIAFNWTGWIGAAIDDMSHVYSKDGVAYSRGTVCRGIN